MSKRARSATIGAEIFKEHATMKIQVPLGLIYQDASADSTFRGINEEGSESNYSEVRSQYAALARRTLLDEYAGGELYTTSL